MLPDFFERKVLVLGDVMLDHFVRGRVERISPEAPVPVLLASSETIMPGGAGNVARNIASLGGNAILIGITGNDAPAAILQKLLEADPRITTDFLHLADHPTIQKIRYISDQQQLLRVDMEEIYPDQHETLMELFRKYLYEIDAIILSDYAKGVLSPQLIADVVAAARLRGVPVVADPKNVDFTRYNGVTVLTPNRHEAALATGIRNEDDLETARAAETIMRCVPDCEAAMVTRGPRGFTLARRDGTITHTPAKARAVFDVSGAGDTLIATLALSLAANASLEEAAQLANTAAGIVVAKPGTATVSAEELEKHLHPARAISDFKLVTRAEAAAAAAHWREKGLKVGFTNGCFDLIHPGHISLLSQSRAECDRLVVGLNADASVSRLKGPERPIQDEVSRALVLGSLSAVDLVVVFEENTPLELIEAVRPDVLVKGQDYTIDKVVGASFVQSYGGRVVLANLKQGQSTTNTIARMMSKAS